MAWDPNQPRVPKGVPGAGRWAAVIFQDDEGVFADMSDLIDQSEFDHFGIRIEDVMDPVAEGEVLRPSRVWVDGEPTDEILGGTSTLGIKGNIDVPRAMQMLGATSKNTQGGYFGKVIYLVGGYDSYPGEDAGERIIPDATVIGVYIRDRDAFSSVNARL